mmetsp:Transcript_21307/g.46521  ORF Transcript_21307/g.46521 Transcript_21307/m.46521 type:complete len:498 (+) Transcript_21307:156-1649(+)
MAFVPKTTATTTAAYTRRLVASNCFRLPTATATTTKRSLSLSLLRQHTTTATRAYFSSDNNNDNDNNSHTTTNIPFRWLNLENAGLSMLERLSLEEYLLKHTRDNWILVGRHSVWPPKHISVPNKQDVSNSDGESDNDSTNNSATAATTSEATTNNRNQQQKHNRNHHLKILPEYITNSNDKTNDNNYGDDHDFGGLPNPNGMIVMGIGGKAEKLLNTREVQTDRLLVVKRFSGGGTVVMDENAIWTTLIAGRRTDSNIDTIVGDTQQKQKQLCQPYPRDIMEWTANAVFGPTFEKLNDATIAATRTTATTTNPSTSSSLAALPTFSLREDDYVLTAPTTTTTTTTAVGSSNNIKRETRKMGGNAQAISGKQGWLHHTSFLWDYENVNMERYLKLPEKRPEYRVDRSHKDFLVKLKDYYHCRQQRHRGDNDNNNDDNDDDAGPSLFVESMKQACAESLPGGIRETDWSTVYREVFDNNDAKLHAWWLENRTRIQHDL